MPSRPNTSASRSPGLGLLGGQQPVGCLDDRYLGAEPGEHLRELRADRAAAQHDQRPGDLARSRSPPGWSSTACPARPGTGGMAGSVPVLMHDRRAAPGTPRCPRPVDGDLAGRGEPPAPADEVPPLPVNRSTATLSSQSSVASSRIRRGDRRPVGVDARGARHARDPARLGEQVRGADHHLGRHAAPVRALAADQPGLHPGDVQAGLGQLPAASSPPGPIPITTTSTSRSRSVMSPPGASHPRARVYRGECQPRQAG